MAYIRLADPSDINAVMELLTKFHAERGIAPMSRDKVEQEVSALIDLADLFVVEVENAIVGALGLVENVLWYSDGHVLNDRFLYVVPEHRKGRIGSMLLRAAKLEANRRTIPFFVTIQDSKRAKRCGRVAEVEGYVPTGYVIRLS